MNYSMIAEMTFQTGSIIVIGTLATVAATLFGIQQKAQERRLTKVEKKSEECEKHRNQLQEQMGDLKRQVGLAEGMVKHFERCHVPECPMRQPAAAYSLQ